MSKSRRNPNSDELLVIAGLGLVVFLVWQLQGTGSALGNVGSGVGGAAGNVGSGVGGAFGNVGSGIGSALGNLGSGIGDALGNTGSGIGSTIGGGNNSTSSSDVSLPPEVTGIGWGWPAS